MPSYYLCISNQRFVDTGLTHAGRNSLPITQRYGPLDTPEKCVKLYRSLLRRKRVHGSTFVWIDELLEKRPSAVEPVMTQDGIA